jgi:serine/threonine protein kinase
LRKEKASDYEDVIEVFEYVLPKEILRKKFIEYTQNQSNLLETLNNLINLTQERKNTWEMEGEEPYKEEALETIKTLNALHFDSSLFLGKGNAGHVFTAPGNKYCVKYLHNPDKQSFNIDEEFTLLNQAYKISKTFTALHIPQAHCVAKNLEKTKNFFTMEKINGLTLAQLVDFPSKRITEYPSLGTEKIIDILEDKNLRDALLKDLSKLHQEGIVHGDIHTRNIMLRNDGTIFLIDFGNAVIPVNVSTQATYEHIENIKDLDNKTFTNSIEKTIIELKKQLTSA